jgi:hypothetical protein
MISCSDRREAQTENSVAGRWVDPGAGVGGLSLFKHTRSQVGREIWEDGLEGFSRSKREESGEDGAEGRGTVFDAISVGSVPT